MGKRTLLTDIVDLADFDHDNANEAINTLKIREFGVTNQHLSDIRLLRSYIAEFLPSTKENRGETFQHRSTVISIVIAILAIIMGYLSAVGLLRYDGSHPVNVLQFLGVLFFVQLFSLFTFLLAWLGLYSEGLGSIMRTFSISNWISRIGMGQHDWLDRIPITTWQAVVLTKSQLFISFFFIGTLVALLYQASTSDIAFGWSSTLNFSSDTFYRFCSFVSLPWSAFIAEANIDATLIEATRYFRLRDQPLATEANTYGLWWPFLAMTILVWGILPRLFTLILSIFVERSILKKVLLQSAPGQSALATMRTPTVSTQSINEESTFNQPESNASLTKSILPKEVDYVVFNGAFEAKNVILERLNLIGSPSIEIGAHQSIDEDNAAIKTLKNGAASIVMVVKAWEPPIMDTMDNIDKILDLNSKSHLTICPVASDFSLDGIEGYHIDSWQRAISGLPANRVTLIHKV